MTSSASPIVDALASLIDPGSQRDGAHLAQVVFGEVFRHAWTPDPVELGQILKTLAARCLEWCQAGEVRTLSPARLALLVSGLDQWGLAYTQTFSLTAIPALTALIAALRTSLDPQSEALFQQYFEQMAQKETNAVDFKVELRRGIHLALWHAMAACETSEEAQSILQVLGSFLLALNQQWPTIGWRLVADALAHIQIGLLNGQTSELARISTQSLFAALQHVLPEDRYQLILHQAGQAVLAWQQARRGGN